MAEGVERGDNSAMSQNSSLMSGVDCLLTTWAPDQMSCIVHKPPSPTSSSSTLLWLSRPFLGGVNESRLTKRPALSCAVKNVKIKLLSVLCTLEMPRSGTLDLRSVADSRRFWFLRAVRKLSSLCRAAADTAREEVSEDISLNKVETRNSCRHLTWTGVHLRGEVRRATERATSQVRPRQGKLGQAQADLNLSLPLPLS